MELTTYSIGELAKRCDCPIQTIRYYEGLGLLDKPARTPGNQRRYVAEALRRLTLIRHCRELGFPLEEIRQLLAQSACAGARCDAISGTLRRQLSEVEKKIRRLRILKRNMETILDQCRGGSMRTCRIVKALSDTSHVDCGVAHFDSPQACDKVALHY